MYEFCICSFQYGNVGAMAITLCQSLGQNIGMKWNNARNSAGKKKKILKVLIVKMIKVERDLQTKD